MKTFENWYTNILEEVAIPAKTLAGDVDTIINSLDILVKELTEELDSPEFSELNEAGTEEPGKVWQWIWWMPKAKKAQQKVNKIKMNVTDIEAAAEDAPDPKQEKALRAKASATRDQVDKLQDMVDDKFKTKGELVQRVIHSEKIAGQIASIKRVSGLEDDPKKKASYKEKMAELQQKYKDDQEALKELEPSEADISAEKEKKKEEKEAAAAKNAELDKKIQDEKNRKEAADKADKDKKDGNVDGEEPKKDGNVDGEEPKKDGNVDGEEPKKDGNVDGEEPKKDGNVDSEEPKKDGTDSNTDEEPKKDGNVDGEEPKKDDTDSNTDEEPKKDDNADDETKKERESKNSKEGKLKRLQDMLAKAKDSGDEEKIKKVQDLIDKISAKESWQLDGTLLGMMIESEIIKLEMSFKLNESRFYDLNIKDRFSRLL